MGIVKQIDIKNRTYYFYNDMVDIKKFDSNLLKIDKKSYKDIGIYNIGYITSKKIDDYENIYCGNPLYLTISHASGYIEEKDVNKYLVLAQWNCILEMKIKSYLKNAMMFFMKLEAKSKKEAVMNVIMKKIT